MIALEAPLWSFTDPPISIPTPEGFSDRPGCVESHVARADVKAFLVNQEDGRSGLIEQRTVPLCALEFGGMFQGLERTSKGFDALWKDTTNEH